MAQEAQKDTTNCQHCQIKFLADVHNKVTAGGNRTRNLLITRPRPYPHGHQFSATHARKQPIDIKLAFGRSPKISAAYQMMTSEVGQINVNARYLQYVDETVV